MALIKKIETETGIETNYHNIGYLELNKTDGYLTARVHSFVSKEKRNEGKRHVGAEYYQIPQTVWRETYAQGGNIIKAVYDYLLTIDKFSGAVSDV